MTEKLAFQLRTENKLTACITVKLRYSNFDTHTMQARIPYSSSDHTLISRAKELFEKLYERRMLVRLLGVRFSHLVGGGHQINLLEDSEEMINLYLAMDKLRQRFGKAAIHRAIGSGRASKSFNPFKVWGLNLDFADGQTLLHGDEQEGLRIKQSVRGES